MPLNVERISKAVEHLARKEPIALAYLHGSYANERADRESDIDIAIVADSSLSREERFDLRLRALGSLSEILHLDLESIDLVVLQDATILLQYNAMRKGIRIFERDRSERIQYELRVEQEYDDERYYLKRESEIILNRMLQRPA